MTRRSCVAAAGAMAILSAQPAWAQTPSPSWFQRTFGVDLRAALCAVGPGLIKVVANEASSVIATTVARNIGLCPAAGQSTIPPATPGDPAGLSVSPGLQIRVLAVKGTVDAPVIEAGTPDTLYGQGEGFALVLASNAPGFLEVWSIDATSETFVEGIVLNPDRASVVTLPRVVEGAYRFDTAGGRDAVRLKYLPCRPADPQSFRPVANARVAQAVSVSAPVRIMTHALPTCPFATTVALTVPQTALFGAITAAPAVFASGSNSYTAVLPTASGQPALRALSTEIEFKRR